MKTQNPSRLIRRATALFAAISATATASLAFANGPVLDSFNDATLNDYGATRLFIDDTAAGGKTSVSNKFENGVLVSSGTITPPRGQPGWASMALLLKPDGSPADLSQYKGVALKIKVAKGNVNVSANSSEVQNYDYHAAPIARTRGDEIQEVRIDFSDMKRAWSAPTKLNLATITSISVVAADLQPGEFAFELDEVSFY